ncbi:MAG: CCA tRNA nucleotidyltransferase [Candidatus Puniceispirillales bacterium]
MTGEAALRRLLDRALPQRIMTLIAAGGGEARLVGGVVRDVLNGADPDHLTDLDMAVNRPPQECRDLLEAHGFRVIPTGIDHGTITVVDHHHAAVKVELTSLRADIRTDGRHAEVVFGTDWEADAERRDFTINALYLAADGSIFDPLGGREDLAAGRVRFVGMAAPRIREDYLRMLRFFRFHARFGRGAPDAEAMAAISEHSPGLDRISGERIAQEMRGILAAGHAAAISAMITTGLDRSIARDGFDDDGYDRLMAFVPRVDPMHLLGFLIRGQDTDAVAARLRLSRREAGVLQRAADPDAYQAFGEQGWAAAAYGASRDAAMTPAVMAGLYAVAAVAAGGDVSAEAFGRLHGWRRPQFPITGDDLIDRGMAPGQAMGRCLKALEHRWIDAGFTPDREALLKILDAGGLNE